MRSVLLGSLIAAVVVGVLYLSTLQERGVQCEACMSYGGRSHCSRVAGATREAAEYAAVSNACSAIASGVTRSLDCQRSQPVSLRCEGDAGVPSQPALR